VAIWWASFAPVWSIGPAQALDLTGGSPQLDFTNRLRELGLALLTERWGTFLY
jgi:hypothetical protein